MNSISYPRVRLDDGSPACDVASREVVRRPRAPTGYATKKRLRRTVDPLGVPAGRTLPGGVLWVNPDQRHPGPLRFVPDFLAQVMERPAMQRSPLGLPEPYPFANPLEVFQGKAAPGALSLGYDAFADAVAQVVGEVPLFARKLFQTTLGRLGALLLQLLPESSVAVSDRVQVLARVGLAVRVGGDVDDAQVNPQKALRVKDRRILVLAPQVDVPGVPPPDQLTALDALGGSQQVALIPRDMQRHLQPPLHCGEADHLVRNVQREDAPVVVNAGGLEPACPVPLALANPSDGPHRQVGREAEAFAEFAVKGELVPGILPTRHPQGVVASTCKLIHRAGKLLGRTRIRYQFAPYGEEGHTCMNCITELATPHRASLGFRFLSASKCGASTKGVL